MKYYNGMEYVPWSKDQEDSVIETWHMWEDRYQTSIENGVAHMHAVTQRIIGKHETIRRAPDPIAVLGRAVVGEAAEITKAA